ncbi:MAG: hypothetical protein RLY58_1801 [Pseudomonadota bacterium]
MAHLTGLEPATIRLEGGCSIQLSYRRMCVEHVRSNDKANCWSESKDSNLGPPGPKPGALPDCATLRVSTTFYIAPSLVCALFYGSKALTSTHANAFLIKMRLSADFLNISAFHGCCKAQHSIKGLFGTSCQHGIHLYFLVTGL